MLAQRAARPARDASSDERTLSDAERVERDADGVQQPRHVVVGRDEQRGGIAERLVVEQQPRVDVAVRRDHRQLAHRVVQLGARSPALRARRAAADPGAARARTAVSVMRRIMCTAHRQSAARSERGGGSDADRDSGTAGRAARIGGTRRRARRGAGPRRSCTSSSPPTDSTGAASASSCPDGTRSCPLPLLLSAVHGALHGRVTRLTVLVALGTHARDERAGARRAPRVRGGGLASAIRDDRAQPRVVGPGHVREPSGRIGAERIAELSGGMLRPRPSTSASTAPSSSTTSR